MPAPEVTPIVRGFPTAQYHSVQSNGLYSGSNEQDGSEAGSSYRCNTTPRYAKRR
jgi:hypothetical protein